ncbi:MetQ/NlpA family ABC transporter substrate-binding protein [Stigmatella aurantiaca]|uniref:ABC D-methionine uptake transporter, substrate-binding protein n=1 Tax=Stigmatella aurantiaca (strain DW4/3-1) TaxID=378806 RepID=Q08QR2_STIAD|nr:MetQ/NlpA family ABC transporter substrate-binding protein [Stigmatella aurantiaca]ADO71574.1 D-methionine ABC transporter, substrate-binding protein [Stigmatella aurantiaca DW4/3-1]EAU62818.1 ABC D-methionine uptake transporter, substrate-binding protein [Stigmatella aurantiaca DW4/3-1]
MSKHVSSVMLLSLVLAVSNGCAKNDAHRLKVGVTSGAHAQILEVVAAEALKKGVHVQVVEFSDYVQPNAALADGSLDANSFQHLPYLEQQRKDRGYRLTSIGTTVTFPIAAYSVRHEKLDALPTGATIAIPNDPTNGARALALLQTAGLIRLRTGAGPTPTPLDVEWSRGGFHFKELEAAQLARVLSDVDLAVINTNYALEGGLDPFKGLVRESAQSPYANVIAVRADDAGRAEFKTLVEAYHSPEVRQFIERTFKGAVVPAW